MTSRTRSRSRSTAYRGRKPTGYIPPEFDVPLALMQNGVAPDDAAVDAFYRANPEILYMVMNKSRMPSVRRSKPKVWYGFP